MTAQQKQQDDLDVLLDTLLEELMGMSDEQVLDGEGSAAVQARGLALLSSAKQVAAKRRLAGAKAGLAIVSSETRASSDKPVSAAQARAFLRQAANAGKYTMAARQLDELSDQAALALCSKFLRLGIMPPDAGDEAP